MSRTRITSALILVLAVVTAPARATPASSPMDDLRGVTLTARPGQSVVLETNQRAQDVVRYRAYLTSLRFGQRFGQEHDVRSEVVHAWVEHGSLIPITLRRARAYRWRFRVPRVKAGRYAYAVWCPSCGGRMAISWPMLGTHATPTSARLLRVIL